jgi:hypothetical protein
LDTRHFNEKAAKIYLKVKSQNLKSGKIRQHSLVQESTKFTAQKHLLFPYPTPFETIPSGIMLFVDTKLNDTA